MVLIKAKGLFKCCLNGKSKVNFIAASLIKAAIDPVKVIPPIKVPKNEAILWRLSAWSSYQKDAKEVVTAAKPTKAWKAATVWGS